MGFGILKICLSQSSFNWLKKKISKGLVFLEGMHVACHLLYQSCWKKHLCTLLSFNLCSMFRWKCKTNTVLEDFIQHFWMTLVIQFHMELTYCIFNLWCCSSKTFINWLTCNFVPSLKYTACAGALQLISGP